MSIVDTLSSVQFDGPFRAWLEELEEDVIQDEYGYEPGEFTVIPEDWYPLFCEALTPQQAWQRALDAFADARREEDEKRNAPH